MRNFLGIFTVFGLLFYPSRSYTFLEWAVVLKGDKDIQCCADCHSAFCEDPVADQCHSRTIHSLVSSGKFNHHKFIVEDFEDYQGDNRIVQLYNVLLACGSLQVPKGLISGLAEYCREKHLNVSNVEHRFVREIAVKPILSDGMGSQPTSSIMQKHILVRNLVKEFEDVVKTVQTFDDGEQLNTYYCEQLSKILEHSKPLLSSFNSFDGPLSAYVEKYVPRSRWLSFGLVLIDWDWKLLDLKAIHEVVSAQEKKAVLLMGSVHIRNIVQTLIQYGGYKKCDVVGEEREFESHIPQFDNLEDTETVFAQIKKRKRMPAPLTTQELERVLV